MILYVVLIISLSFISLYKVKGVKDTALLRTFIILFYCLATVRSVSVGTDTVNYYRVFNTIANTASYAGYIGRFEIGYLLLNKAVSLITRNFTVFLAVINLVIYHAYYLFLRKYSSNYGLSLLLFLTLGAWGKTVNVIRLELSVAMFLYAFILFNDKKKALPAIVFGCLGVLFQRISIVFFAVFFVPKKLSKRFMILTTAISVVLLLGLEYVIGFIVSLFPYFAHYLSESQYIFGEIKLSIVLLLVLHMTIFFVSLRLYRKKKSLLGENECAVIESQINMVFISSLVLLISMRFNLLDRCEAIFGVFILLLLPNICQLLKSRSSRSAAVLSVCLTGLAYFIVVNAFRPEWNQIIPYHTFLIDH